MALGKIKAVQITLRFERKSPAVYVVTGSVSVVESRLDQAAAGSGRLAMVDARTGHRFTLDLSEAETYSAKEVTL